MIIPPQKLLQQEKMKKNIEDKDNDNGEKDYEL